MTDYIIHMEDGTEYLMHHGVKGQKWGIRRYQNEDGTLTELGKKRLENYKEKELRSVDRYYNRPLRSGPYGMNIDRNSLKDLDKAIAKAEAKGKIDKIESLKLEKANVESLKMLNSEKVRNMTFDQMTSEKQYVGKEVTKSIAMNAALNAFAMPFGATVVVTKDIGNIKEAYRFNDFQDPHKKKKD